MRRLALNLFEITLILFPLVSIACTALLTRNQFSGEKSLIAGIVGLIIILLLIRPRIIFYDKRFDKWFYIILFLAVLIRIPPYLYVLGGQDQGTYVNMSHQYDLWRGLQAKDPFRAGLSSDLKKVYDTVGNYIMPSFDKWTRGGSDYNMNFYPLHPALMSVFGSIFGSDNRIYSLIFFSIITLVSFYLLALEITGKKSSGYIILILLSLNPLHVFFSKFPVGEIVALAFISSAIYCFYRYFNFVYSEDNYDLVTRYFWLLLSLLLFNGFFYVRFSFFIYLPIILLFTVLVPIYIKNKRIKWEIVSYIVTLILLFLFSYRYYYKFQNVLYNLLMEGRVESTANLILGFLPFNIYIKAIIIFLLWVLFIITVDYFSNRKLGDTLRNIIGKIYFPLLIILFIVLIGKTLYESYQIGWVLEGQYTRFDMSMHGLLSSKHVPLIAVITYLSPFSFLLYLVALHYYSKEKHEIKTNLIVIFSFWFIFTTVLFGDYIKYPYYFIRYYFSESVPYALLVIAIYLSESGVLTKFKKWLLVLTILYFSVFTSIQVFRYEGADLSFFNDINKRVPADSLFIMHDSIDAKVDSSSRNFNLYIFGSLKYYYDYKTIVISDQQELKQPLLKNLISKFDNVYFLSDTKQQDNALFNDEIPLTIYYSYFNNSIGCSKHTYEFLELYSVTEIPLPPYIKCITPPNAYIKRDRHFLLYKLNKEALTQQN